MSQLLAEGLEIAPAVAIDIYRQMSRIREVDEAIQKGLSSGTFQFTYWPMTGQEAIPAVISHSREIENNQVPHGDSIAVRVRQIVAG
jgi:TPP-dependent pyruvate/acetoin dehydrogenase alpha subunit